MFFQSVLSHFGCSFSSRKRFKNTNSPEKQTKGEVGLRQAEPIINIKKKQAKLGQVWQIRTVLCRINLWQQPRHILIAWQVPPLLPVSISRDTTVLALCYLCARSILAYNPVKSSGFVLCSCCCSCNLTRLCNSFLFKITFGEHCWLNYRVHLRVCVYIFYIDGFHHVPNSNSRLFLLTSLGECFSLFVCYCLSSLVTAKKVSEVLKAYIVNCFENKC